MKYRLRNSFHFRLMVSFLAVSLIPLCLCSALLVQIASVHMNWEIKENMKTDSDSMIVALDDLALGFEDVGKALQNNPVLMDALTCGLAQETQIYNVLYEAAGSIREVCTLHIYDLKGNPLFSSHSSPQPQKLKPTWGVLNAARTSGKASYMGQTAELDSEVALLRAAFVLKNQQTPIGYLVMEVNSDHFKQLLNGKYGNQGEILILNRFWRPVYSSQQLLFTDVAAQLRSRVLAGYIPEGDNPDCLYSITKHDKTDLLLVQQQPHAFNHRTLHILMIVSACWAVVCIIISVFLSIPLSRQISSPIGKLRSAFGKLEQDDLDVRISLDRQDELGQLAIAFNHMVNALKTNRAELMENQKELNETKLRMLQAQLNPHFLGNTLDTMKWISKINNMPEVAMMSTDLADILRFCISGEEFVPLYRELEILERYIEIQRIRLSDQFSFQVDVPEELLGHPVPKMILQPIVENAILHGLVGVERSLIRVKAEKWQEEFLRVTVTDNGRGIPEEMAGKPYSRETLPDKHHLGLYNVHMILKLHYAEDAGLFLDRGPDGTGTSVTATLPLQTAQEECEC